MAEGDFDVQSFTKKWGKCIEDIRACNKLLAGRGSAEGAKEKIDAAVAKGTGFPSNLGKTLSAISSITNFLSHSDEDVRKYAAKALAVLIVEAVRCLDCETDPQVIMKTSVKLLDVIDKIKSSGAADPSTRRVIASAKKAIDKKLANIFEPDQFVSAKEIQKAEQDQIGNKSNLPSGFKKKFGDTINQVRENLIGDITYKGFLQSHDNTMKTLIGEF